MNTFNTLKAHLDAAWNQLTESDLYRRAQAEATEAFRELRTPPRIYQRLDELQESIFETAALLADDDIAEILDTIAKEIPIMNAKALAKAMYEYAPLDTYTVPWDEADETYKQGQIRAAQKIIRQLDGVYALPVEPQGPLWDNEGDKWMRSKENMWYGGNQDMYRSWGDIVHYSGPLTTTPPTPLIKVGDTGLTAEQVWGLPKGTVIWPERAGVPEPWLRLADGCGWESLSDEAFDAGSLQCVCGDGFTVLRLGGGE